MMRKLLLPALMLYSSFLYSQNNLAVVDSFKNKLAQAKTHEERVWVLGPLSMILMNTDIAQADRYGDFLNREAELSRNRELIVKAHMFNGQRYSFFTNNKDHLNKALLYYNKALDIAKKNKLDKETAEALLSISTVYTSMPELDKAMNYSSQAMAIVSNLDNDSLKVATYYSFGSVYQERKERIMALRNYLNALTLAEEIKDPLLMRSCYYVLSQFYSDINEMDKAIDYLRKSTEQLPLIDDAKMPNKEYTSVVDLYMMGEFYVKKKDYSMSEYYYDSSIRMAEQVKYYPLKMPGYSGILRQYIAAKQPQRALEYLNNRTDLRQFIVNFGAPHVVDHSYAAIYTQMGQYDSARVYFAKSEAGFENTSTPAGKMSFYYQYGDFYNKSGNHAKALEYFNKAMEIAVQSNDLEWQQRIAHELDTVYAATGNFKMSKHYSSLYHQFKDSLQKLSEEKDLLQMELANEEQRQQRIERERAAALRERHQLQYMGITISIAVVFLILVLMGAFRVSETTIKIMGFFAFIILFEFIILIADNKIHHWTHGEPLQILGIKIILIAMLLPLHHWLEHKVVNYLTTKRLILPDTKSIWKNIITRSKDIKHN